MVNATSTQPNRSLNTMAAVSAVTAEFVRVAQKPSISNYFDYAPFSKDMATFKHGKSPVVGGIALITATLNTAASVSSFKQGATTRGVLQAAAALGSAASAVGSFAGGRFAPMRAAGLVAAAGLSVAARFVD